MDVKAIKVRANQMIEAERERCRRAMGDAAWDVHNEWVTRNIVEAAKQWLVKQASEGFL
ncbi:hypothetical protein [Burkholderia ubonensis]|uniref:hypothetical protein n=1 Tax=Burkholderia ubonensis TaxID=101571 RepID=UPI000A6FE21B|nr:hypothetical protein [Burkholderia ubonensis]